uniref:Uncharacterized protein n=1 Tax=Romanomermis culicivorax TaxID=13658 RepID=A0A915KVL3_ROMCU
MIWPPNSPEACGIIVDIEEKVRFDYIRCLKDNKTINGHEKEVLTASFAFIHGYNHDKEKIFHFLIIRPNLRRPCRGRSVAFLKTFLSSSAINLQVHFPTAQSV